MRPIRVLLADSDELLLASYCDFLARDGFDVAAATNGLDCVDRLCRFWPDVLVLEPELPGGWGDSVLGLIHDRSGVPPVPVIVLSSGHGFEDLYRVVAFRVGAYHVKPLAPTGLARTIRHLLGKTAPRPDPAPRPGDRAPAPEVAGPTQAVQECRGDEARPSISE